MTEQLKIQPIDNTKVLFKRNSYIFCNDGKVFEEIDKNKIDLSKEEIFSFSLGDTHKTEYYKKLGREKAKEAINIHVTQYV